jgi:hypothetical protein
MDPTQPNPTPIQTEQEQALTVDVHALDLHEPLDSIYVSLPRSPEQIRMCGISRPRKRGARTGRRVHAVSCEYWRGGWVL